MVDEYTGLIVAILMALGVVYLARFIPSLILMREFAVWLLGLRRQSWLGMFEHWMVISAILTFLATQPLSGLKKQAQELNSTVQPAVHAISMAAMKFYVATQAMINDELYKFFQQL